MEKRTEATYRGRKTGSDGESLPGFDESALRVTGGEEGLSQSQAASGLPGASLAADLSALIASANRRWLK